MAEMSGHDIARALPRQAAPLEPRERDVLAELARDVEASVSFQGLRRQLGLHQQALTRTLRRLEAAGLVARDPHGYQLTPEGERAARVPGSAVAPPSLVLVHALLPPHVTAAEAAALLARRWFGGLRWHGRSDAPGETSLHWVVESGNERVSLRIRDGSLALDAEVLDADAARAFAAARPVLVALAELYGIPPPKGEVAATFAGGPQGIAA